MSVGESSLRGRPKIIRAFEPKEGHSYDSHQASPKFIALFGSRVYVLNMICYDAKAMHETGRAVAALALDWAGGEESPNTEGQRAR